MGGFVPSQAAGVPQPTTEIAAEEERQVGLVPLPSSRSASAPSPVRLAISVAGAACSMALRTRLRSTVSKA